MPSPRRCSDSIASYTHWWRVSQKSFGCTVSSTSYSAAPSAMMAASSAASVSMSFGTSVTSGMDGLLFARAFRRRPAVRTRHRLLAPVRVHGDDEARPAAQLAVRDRLHSGGLLLRMVLRQPPTHEGHELENVVRRRRLRVLHSPRLLCRLQQRRCHLILTARYLVYLPFAGVFVAPLDGDGLAR